MQLDPSKPENNPAADDNYIGLRCNKCNKPINPADAVLTPTGYRCKECVRGQQKIFDTTKPFDSVLGFLVAGLIAFAGSWLASRIGFITLLLAPGVGLLISNAVRMAVSHRRSAKLNNAVLTGAVVGCAPLLIMALIPLFISHQGILPSLAGLLPLICQVLYAVAVPSSAYAHMKGFRLK